MRIKYKPLVQKTKVELERLDKKSQLTWVEHKEFNNEFLPISVEPKLRTRALKFMNELIHLLELNGHGIKFYLNRCHVEMYGQLTEIRLRQKYFRKRIIDKSGYGTYTYEKSTKLEFLTGSFGRKIWIDRKTKSLEDYLPTIYNYIEKDSQWWYKHREEQRVVEEQKKHQQKIELEQIKKFELENEKTKKLIKDAESYKTATTIRLYIAALQKAVNQNDKLNNTKNQEYIKWAFDKANEIDPINDIL